MTCLYSGQPPTVAGAVVRKVACDAISLLTSREASKRGSCMKTSVVLVGIAAVAAAAVFAQGRKYVPVTQEMLLNPSPDDWLMFSRTYDAQRFSPLKQVTK